MWGLAYTVLLLALFVRFGPPQSAHRPVRPEPGEPLRLVGLHHMLFYVLLLAAPLEAVVVGGASDGRTVGLALFALGVLGYRRAGAALGDALSPLVSPRPDATLVTGGPYRLLRHPMYLSQALIAVGAPLTLGCRWVTWLAVPAIVVLVVRMRLEDAALARRFPQHAEYAASAKRIVPFVY
jgi:protein-S-isoprenylcysteine O-methyltransferase Ste14